MRDSSLGLLVALIGLASAVAFILGEPTRGNVQGMFRGWKKRQAVHRPSGQTPALAKARPGAGRGSLDATPGPPD